MTSKKSVKKVVMKSVKKAVTKSVLPLQKKSKPKVEVNEIADRGQLAIVCEILRLNIKNKLGIGVK